MTDRDARPHAPEPSSPDDPPYPYPSAPLAAGSIASDEEVEHVVTALAVARVPKCDLTVMHGAAAAEKMKGTGRTGWMDMVARFTEMIGLPNDEVTLRSSYAAALTDGRFVVSVQAPSDARKALAARVKASMAVPSSTTWTGTPSR